MGQRTSMNCKGGKLLPDSELIISGSLFTTDYLAAHSAHEGAGKADGAALEALAAHRDWVCLLDGRWWGSAFRPGSGRGFDGSLERSRKRETSLGVSVSKLRLESRAM